MSAFVVSNDRSDGTPNVPNANATGKWRSILWRRNREAGQGTSTSIYLWDEAITTEDSVYLKWVPIGNFIATTDLLSLQAGSTKMSVTSSSGNVYFDVVESALTIANISGDLPLSKLPATVALVDAANTFSLHNTFSAGLTGALTGNATTATTLANSRSIYLTGDATGSVSGVDWATDVTINTTVTHSAVGSSSPYWNASHLMSRVIGNQTPVDGDVYAWDQSEQEWAPVANVRTTLADLIDVSISSPTNGQFIQYDSSSSAWENFTPTTSDITEGTNLYYTDTRVRLAVSASSPITYNNSTGSIGWNGTTTDVPEGTNLYFTDARVAAAGAVMEADTTTALMSFVKDEDDMASDSATHLATQQSVKAYIDAFDAASTLVELNDTTIASVTDNDFLVYDNSSTSWINSTPATVRTILNVEDGADVTDTANVTSAGALMTAGGAMTGNLDLADNVKLRFGDGPDMAIYHDASNTLFLETGTGSLQMATNAFQVKNVARDEYMIQAVENASVILYANGIEVFSTAEGGVNVTGNIAVTGTVDGRDVAADGTKLDGIEASADVTDATNVASAGAVMEVDFEATSFLYATADNTPVAKTPAEVRTILNVEDGSTADQTNAEIRTAVEAATDSNVFTDADHTKLNAIEAGATAEVAATTTTAGIVELATNTETTTGTDTTRAVTPAGVQAAVDDILDGAPAALDTLNELAAAIDDDASYASTITTALGTKATKVGTPVDNQVGVWTGDGTIEGSSSLVFTSTGLAIGSPAVAAGISIKQSAESILGGLLFESSASTNNGGIFYNTDVLTVRVGGVNTLSVADDGVGIGTTAPASLLDVRGTTTAGVNISVNSGVHHLTLSVAGTNEWKQYVSGEDLRFFADGQDDRVTFTKAGLVGIGTTAPTTGLDVVGGTTISGTGWAAGARANSLVLDNNSGASRLFAVGADATTDGSIQLWTGQTDGGGTQRMTISSAGLVGIGTAAPAHPVDIVAASGARLKVAETGGSNIDISAGGSGGMVTSDGWLDLRTGGANERIRILSTGEVGIGTLVPSYRLHVTGDTANGDYLAYIYNSGVQSNDHGLNAQIASSSSTAYGLRVNTGGDSNSLAVMGDGKVGIGRTPTTQRLEVEGNGYFSTTGGELTITNSGASGVTLQQTNGGATDSGTLKLRGGTSVSFTTNDVDDRMTINNAGLVGIGTAAPDEQLHMTGRVHLGQTSAPGTTTDKLYNVGGTLYWNGTDVTSGGGGGGHAIKDEGSAALTTRSIMNFVGELVKATDNSTTLSTDITIDAKTAWLYG